MTATIPPNVHEELALLDAIERELVRLTTADLESCTRVPDARVATPAPPLPASLKTVIPAQADTHAECDVPTENEGAAMRRGDGSPPSLFVIPANRRNNEHHGNN